MRCHRVDLAVRAMVIAALAATPLRAQQPGDSLSVQVDRLFASRDRPDSPGAAVLVSKNGRVVHRKGYGSANLEYRIPITPETVFDIASVSKQFTGMAIAMLIERGDISLDDDVRTYLPELHDFGSTITIRHLLHHTSGIRDWPGTLAIAGWQMDDVISFQQILTMAYQQRDLNFAPGERHLYSNTGYNLLARVVERVSGRSFREWTDAQIFEPLGMTSTHFHDDHTELVARRAYAYRPEASGGFSSINNGLTAVGSSSLFTTLDDLGKWLRNFDDPTVGGAAVIERMRTRGVLNAGDTISYAHGLSVGAYRGLETVSHGGSWAGFRTYLLHFPEQELGVIILGNFATFNPSRPAYQIADIYLAGALDSEPDRTEAAPVDQVQVDHATLDEYAGLYRLGPGWFVTVTRNGDQLEVQATNEAKFPMVAVSETEFHVRAYGASMTFGRGRDGAVSHLDYRNITAPRVAPWSPADDDLREFEGMYYSEELAAAYLIELRDGTLVARHRRHREIELSPVTRDEFGGNVWFAASVEFVRNDTGTIDGLMISNGRALNLRFARVGH